MVAWLSSANEYLETAHNMVFIPMAFESAGVVGRSFFQVLNMVSKSLNEENKISQSQFRVRWRRTIGMVLHKAVAKRCLQSLDEHSGETGRCYSMRSDQGLDTVWTR